jgi:hypothetical protein
MGIGRAAERIEILNAPPAASHRFDYDLLRERTIAPAPNMDAIQNAECDVVDNQYGVRPERIEAANIARDQLVQKQVNDSSEQNVAGC